MQLSPASRVDSFLADLRQHGAASRPAPEPEPEPEPAFAAPPADETPGVELFVSASSSLCRTAKLILADIGVRYVELEVGRDISEAVLVQRRGGPFAMLPLLAVGGRFVGGFPELKELASGGAEALLSAAADDSDGSPASRSSASPSLVHEKLHYEAESHEARRAALQREGIAHGLASPMSAERPPERPASPPQVKPTLVHSPGRELVGQERAGPGVHSLIQTDRALMRHDAPHIAVRRGGGWDSGRASGPSPRASARNAQPSLGGSRAPQRQPQRRRRRRRQQPGGDRSDDRSSTSSLPARAAAPEVDVDELRLKAEEVGERLARLGVGCRLGETSDILAALPLLGLSGEAITVAQAQAGGANASLTLLRVLEGALSRFEQSMQPAAHSPGS